MTDVAYCTREQVQAALNQADSLRNNARIDAAIRAGARQVHAMTNRHFYPITRTQYPNWRRQVQGSILWLDHFDREMLTVDSFTVDGVELIEGTDFYLDPDDGPPYTSLRLLSTSTAAFSSDDRGMVLIGEQGASNDTRAAGTLAGSITSSAGSLTVSDSTLAGVGDLLIIGAERLNVTEKSNTATGATLAGNLTASATERSIAVSDGTLIHAGELITVGAERMFVESIAGNTLTVRRTDNGSLLTSHTSGDAVYAPRVCTIERGATGSTAASHTDGATILANQAPALVSEANLAYALVNLEQGKSAYGRVLGSGDNQREATGRSLDSIVDDLMTAHDRIRSGGA